MLLPCILFVAMFTENLSASKIVSIKDLREMLSKSAQQNAESMQHSGQETSHTTREDDRTTLAHGPVTSPIVQTPSSSFAKPPTLTGTPTHVMRAAAPSTTEGPRPAGMLASLLQGSQAAEAKAYFTGLLPGKTPPPRPVSMTAAVSTTKAPPSYTGFSGKLGSAASGTPKFEFSAVSFSRIST